MLLHNLFESQICSWPLLDQLHLSASTKAMRAKGVGGSDANVIFSGDCERLRALWLEKRGDVDPVDLSSSLPVMLGCWTEPFNRQWFSKISGLRVNRSGELVQCQRHQWRRCLLDGFVDEPPAVWEAKHTNAFSTTEEVTARYMPQLQHNMAVAQAEHAFLSIIFGNHRFEVIEVAADWLYQLELLEAEADFGTAW